MDSLLFPVLFIATWLLFIEHAVLLFILSLPKRTVWSTVTCMSVLLIQLIHCYNTFNVGSPYSYIFAGSILIPVWIGYPVNRCLNKSKLH